MSAEAKLESRLAAIVYAAGEGAQVDVGLAAAARAVRATGLSLAGAVQHNTFGDDRCRCDMTLEDLATGRLVDISENRGKEARGCRLNSAALEEIVGMVGAAVEAGASLLIVNKFGKREVEGSGFRQVIARAMVLGVPVLVAVSRENEAAWSAFTGGMDERLPLDVESIRAWCAKVAGPAAAVGIEAEACAA